MASSTASRCLLEVVAKCSMIKREPGLPLGVRDVAAGLQKLPQRRRCSARWGLCLERPVETHLRRSLRTRARLAANTSKDKLRWSAIAALIVYVADAEVQSRHCDPPIQSGASDPGSGRIRPSDRHVAIARRRKPGVFRRPTAPRDDQSVAHTLSFGQSPSPASQGRLTGSNACLTSVPPRTGRGGWPSPVRGSRSGRSRRAPRHPYPASRSAAYRTGIRAAAGR